MSALWVSVAEADTYFLTRTNAGAWSVTGSEKTAALTTGQHMLENSPMFSYPTTPTQAMKDAVCEQALWLLNYPEWENRVAMQTMGAHSSDIMGETYEWTAKLPIAVTAMDLLYATKVQKGAHFQTIDRA